MMGEGLEENSVMVLQEVAPVPDSAETEGKKKEENLSSPGDPNPPPSART